MKKLRLALYWAVVAVPLCYGVWMTLQKSLELFEPGTAAETVEVGLRGLQVRGPPPASAEGRSPPVRSSNSTTRWPPSSRSHRSRMARTAW